MHSGTVGRAWNGQSIRADKSWLVELPDHLKGALTSAASIQADASFVDVTVDEGLADECRPFVDQCRAALFGPSGPGFAVLRGVPVQGLDLEVTERLYWMIGSLFGVPVTQSGDLDLIGQVRREVRSGEKAFERGYKSAADLEYHCDLTPLAGLLCVHQAPHGGESTLVDAEYVHAVLQAERPDLLAVLYEPFPVGRLGETRPGEAAYVEQPIFAVDGDRFGCFYPGRQMIEHAVRTGNAPPLTPMQAEALDVMEEVAGRPEAPLQYLLQPGDLLWLNDYRVWHGRSEFQDSADADRRRHLLRLWLDIADADPAAPKSIIYDFRFGNVGLTAAERADRILSAAENG
ncbi:TauD/TfdA family dioxygenase [Pseudonocardia sp.]|jgi:hypothetical protein|uniref:TauD/TfdA family dioxygenase n=1 Tax=Pseudonocardia sp. TaxID=60912 RepID=UPI003D0E4695